MVKFRHTSKCTNCVFQVKNQPEEFKGDFDAVVIVVGANNIGQYAVRQSVRAIYDTVELLSSFNAHAKVLACEVGKICISVLINYHA